MSRSWNALFHWSRVVRSIYVLIGIHRAYQQREVYIIRYETLYHVNNQGWVSDKENYLQRDSRWTIQLFMHDEKKSDNLQILWLNSILFANRSVLCWLLKRVKAFLKNFPIFTFYFECFIIEIEISSVLLFQKIKSAWNLRSGACVNLFDASVRHISIDRSNESKKFSEKSVGTTCVRVISRMFRLHLALDIFRYRSFIVPL